MDIGNLDQDDDDTVPHKEQQQHKQEQEQNSNNDHEQEQGRTFGDDSLWWDIDVVGKGRSKGKGKEAVRKYGSA